MTNNFGVQIRVRQRSASGIFWDCRM